MLLGKFFHCCRQPNFEKQFSHLVTRATGHTAVPCFSIQVLVQCDLMLFNLSLMVIVLLLDVTQNSRDPNLILRFFFLSLSLSIQHKDFTSFHTKRYLPMQAIKHPWNFPSIIIFNDKVLTVGLVGTTITTCLHFSLRNFTFANSVH